VKDGLRLVNIGSFPCKSAITQARQRLGARVMSQLFHQLIRPIATQETLGAFLNGLRIVVIDGTCFDVPDSDENARVFGRFSSRPGTQAAFPKVRLVILVEAGTHLIFDAIRVSISHRRTSAGIEVITLCTIRDVVDVG
jgi:hypothetical protein